MKPNQLNAIYNFHIQNIEFLFKKFNSYSIDLITKLANIFSILLNLKEDQYNIQLKNIEGATEDIYKPIPEPYFCYIINKKLMEVKHCFTNYKLFPDPKEPRQPNKETHFYLTNKELNIILSYLNQSYFPFIRLFYHVINLNRIETKKINSSANKPLAIVNNNDLDSAPEKFIIEEQVKRPVEKEKKIDEKINEDLENRFDLNNIKQRQFELENRTRNDYIHEVRKLITEKVEELKKDVDAKISENGLEIERNIPVGQTEAGLSLGFTPYKTFTGIVLPQALRHGLPLYAGDCVKLLQSTSIVGYIAIQDLTRASDLIRSRTFDALIPLLIITIIYFLLAWLIRKLLNLLLIRK